MLITRRERIALVYTILLTVLLGVVIFLFYRIKPAIISKRSIGCIICHPAKFYKTSHPPYAQIQCLSCHTKHKDNGDGPSELIAKPPQLCFQCHQNIGKLTDKPYAHVPFKKGKCLTCHKPHGSDESYMLASESKDLCRSCHFLTKYTNRKDQHLPYQKGWCIVCHTGHASDYAVNLRASQKEICMTCHQSLSADMNSPYQMKPFAEGKCTKCHNPHSSNNQTQLQQPLYPLCTSSDCHPSQAKDFAQQYSHPVAEGTITCLNCHRPHASLYDKQLLRPFDDSAGGCGACHVPHGSSNKNLVKGAGGPQGICLSCHERSAYDQPYTHPVANKYDPNAKQALTCTSTCHPSLYWPAGNMGIFANEICLLCHTGHNSPLNAIGSKHSEETKLLRFPISVIQARDWNDIPRTGQVYPTPQVTIETPSGKSKVTLDTLTLKARELINKYHRLPESDQFIIKTDKGCALCHEIKNLP